VAYSIYTFYLVENAAQLLWAATCLTKNSELKRILPWEDHTCCSLQGRARAKFDVLPLEYSADTRFSLQHFMWQIRCLVSFHTLAANNVRNIITCTRHSKHTITLVITASFHDNMGKPEPECQTMLGLLQREMMEVAELTTETLRSAKLQSSHHY